MNTQAAAPTQQHSSAPQSALVRYNAARRALAEAHRVDEVKDIRDKALAMKAYALQARDGSLLRMATEIKARAERRAGVLLREMPKQAGARGTGKKVESTRVDSTLKGLGISKDQSSDWQKIANIPEAKFEQVLATQKPVTTKALVAVAPKKAQTATPRPKSQKQLARAQERERARVEKRLYETVRDTMDGVVYNVENDLQTDHAKYVANTLEWCQQEKIPASLLLERLQREVEVQARALADVRQITEVLQRSVMDGGALDPEAARP